MSRVRYGVQVEFEVDGILEGGPSKATIRKTLRGLLENLTDRARYADADPCWCSLSNISIKYLHEASINTTAEKREHTRRMRHGVFAPIKKGPTR